MGLKPWYLARVAYDAYCKTTGGKSAITGADLPAFYDTPQAVRDAWLAAATAVRNEIEGRSGQ